MMSHISKPLTHNNGNEVTWTGGELEDEAVMLVAAAEAATEAGVLTAAVVGSGESM